MSGGVAIPRAAAGAVRDAIAGGSVARMREAAQRFEAQALGALLQPAFGQAPKGIVSGGAAEAQWRPMLVENYARGWAARGGVGIADAVLGEMVRAQAGRRAAGSGQE